MTDITLQNFEADLINASMKQPVLLDIWAPWCGPCKTLGPLLEKLEVAYAGRFKLAKLNSDQQPEIAGQLSQMFGVRSIPFCVMFSQGQPVDGFVGALGEADVRAFLDRHVPSAEQVAADEEVQEAGELLAEGATEEALQRLQEALAIDPNNDGARFDYLRALLEMGRVEQAREVFEPVRGKLLADPRLTAIGHWIEALDAAAKARPPEQLAAAIAANKRDFAARFELAQVHFAARRHTEAMDELIEILMRDKGWNDGAARKAYVAILELMSKPAATRAEPSAPQTTLELSGKATAPSTDPLVDQYRRKLSMALF